MQKNVKKLIALAAAVCVSLCGCVTVDLRNALQTSNPQKPENTVTQKHENTVTQKPENPSQTASGENKPSDPGVFYNGSRGTVLSLSADNSLTISRLGKKNEQPTGDKGVWTVFVYMCGTDLESKQASATEDLNEMLKATSKSKNLRFVVETDGTKKWQNDVCKAKTKQRFLISGGKIKELYSGKSTNMGLSSTLSSFVQWGAENYSSEFMVLDLWDHGGGSISGVCFDENFNYDSLSLKEIDEALAAAFDKIPHKFEIIGCDACLMATVEAANVFAPYGKYAVLSQNLESGYGWDYESFSKGINGKASNGAELGRYICDGYYDYCVKTGEQNDATMSVIDLSKIDAFLYDFHSFAMEINTHCNNDATDFIKAAKKPLTLVAITAQRAIQIWWTREI